MPALTSTSGILAPAGTFISERTERTSPMSAISQPISASAALSARPSKAGQAARQSTSSPAGSAPARRSHSSSVMNGMNGCRSFMIWSSAQAVVARVSALAASLPPSSTGFVSSRYQSQKVPQVKS